VESQETQRLQEENARLKAALAFYESAAKGSIAV